MIFDSNGTFLHAVLNDSIKDILSNDQFCFETDNKRYIIINPGNQKTLCSESGSIGLSKINSYLNSVFLLRSPFSNTFKEMGSILTPVFNRHYTSGMILDLGCSNKYYFRNLPSPVSVDIDSKRLIDLKKKCNPEEIYINGDSCNLPFKSETFSLVICNFILEHVSDPLSLLAESSRVLKSSGKMILTIPTLNFSEFLKMFVFRKTPGLPINHVRSFSVINYQYVISILRIIAYLKRNRFRIIESKGVIQSKNSSFLHIKSNLYSLFPFKFFCHQFILVAQKK